MIAQPLEYWRCLECLKDLREDGGIETYLTAPYNGDERTRPLYYAAFCDPQCLEDWHEHNDVHKEREDTTMNAAVSAFFMDEDVKGSGWFDDTPEPLTEVDLSMALDTLDRIVDASNPAPDGEDEPSYDDLLSLLDDAGSTIYLLLDGLRSLAQTNDD